MGTPLTDDDFAEQLRTFGHTAFRLELQPVYLESGEHDTVAKFLAGDPQPPTEVPGLAAWFRQITELTRQGKRIERVRVHETRRPTTSGGNAGSAGGTSNPARRSTT